MNFPDLNFLWKMQLIAFLEFHFFMYKSVSVLGVLLHIDTESSHLTNSG